MDDSRVYGHLFVNLSQYPTARVVRLRKVFYICSVVDVKSATDIFYESVFAFVLVRECGSFQCKRTNE